MLQYQTIIPPSSRRKRQQDALRQNINHLLRINKKGPQKITTPFPYFLCSHCCAWGESKFGRIRFHIRGYRTEKNYNKDHHNLLLNVGLSDSFARTSQLFYSGKLKCAMMYLKTIGIGQLFFVALPRSAFVTCITK